MTYALPFDVYPWFAISSSLAILALFTAHAVDAGASYRAHHDDRAALDLLVAVTLMVAAMGLTVSASASFLDFAGLAGRNDLRNAGLGIARGALLVTAGTMFAIDRQLSRMR